jgi:ComF family protein
MIEQIIGVIAPHACISCKKEDDLLCYECRSHLRHPEGEIALPSIYSVTAATIYEEDAKELVGNLKFARAKAAAYTIAAIMAERVKLTDVVVTHLPTATSRVRMRGYDQAALIAREYARLCQLYYVPLLFRMGHERQVGAGRAERQRQLARAFRPRGNPSKYSSVVLIDDVITTGATLESAALVLRQAGVANVHAAVFAMSRK